MLISGDTGWYTLDLVFLSSRASQRRDSTKEEPLQISYFITCVIILPDPLFGLLLKAQTTNL